MSAQESQRPAAQPGPATSALRRDAADNRARILEAARVAFQEGGPDVATIEIARRAGVSTATLYRRFPTREVLADEVFAVELQGCLAELREAVEDPDSWRGFCRVVVMMCVWQKAERSFGQALLSRFPESPSFQEVRDYIETDVRGLVLRAQDDGRLRADFEWSDMLVLMAAAQGVAAAFDEESPVAGRRMTAYFLQSFRAETASRRLPSPPVADQAFFAHSIPGGVQV